MFKKIRNIKLAALALATALTLALPVAGKESKLAANGLIKPLGPIVVVAPIPGSPKASGKALLGALKAARLAKQTPAQARRIRLEPGVYDIGKASLRMFEQVEIEGSGVDETEIVGFAQSFSDPGFSFAKGVVIGADDTELRNLTVRCVNTPQLDTCITMANHQASPRLSHVRLLADSSQGGHWGLRNTDSSPYLEDVEIIVANGLNNYGMVNESPGSQPEIRRTTITAAGATGDNIGILNKSEGLPTQLVSTEVSAMNGSRAIGILTLNPGELALANPGLTNPEGIVFPATGDVPATTKSLPASQGTLRLINVEIAALDAGHNDGLLGGAYTVELRRSRILSDDSAIDVKFSDHIDVASSELHASDLFARGLNVRIAGSTLLGGGHVTALGDADCSGIRTEAGTADTCP